MTAERYSFVRRIGSGASGPVWFGHDTTLGREVALKRVGVLPGAESVDLARARREARLAASLDHPHIVGVLDMVERPDGHWLVMQYVDGRSLAELLRTDGPLPPDRAAHLMAQVAEGLARAHAAGIVHRDVKPTNVLVTHDDVALLTDFGIARSYDDTVLTQAGLVTGSPAYLSPEVARGLPASPASDMWSLGATLHQTLTGRAPYEADDVLETMHRVVTEPPPRTDLAGWLAPVLEHTLAVDADDRWSAHRVAGFLHAGPAEANAPEATRTLRVDAVPGPTAPSVRKEQDDTDRPTWPWVAGAVVVAVVSVLAFWAGLRNGTAEPPASSGTEDAQVQSPAATTSPSATGGTSPRVAATETASATPSPTPSPSGAPDVAAMRQFAVDYLATVTTDPATTWSWLTPEFQAASGGFDSYAGFWRTVAAARPGRVDASTDDMTVTYEVTYEMRDGRTLSDRVTLRLREQDGTLRVAGES